MAQIVKHDIRHAAMITKLSAGFWTARKYDKKASEQVAKWHGASSDMGRYNKLLLPGDAITYKAIGAKMSAARKVWYGETLPWTDDGERILTSMNFHHCSEVVKVAEDEVKATLPPFYDEYPELVEIAKIKLGSLWNPDDYPTLEELKEKFYIEMKFQPMPDAADFRADLPAAAVKAIKAQIEVDQQRAIEEAMKDPYRRLWDAVTHMASRLSGQPRCPCSNCATRKHEYVTSEFADSLVDNLKELVDVLPRLNLTGDKELDRLVEQVAHGLTAFEPDDIRNVPQIKETLAERARQIQQDMGGFMSVMAA